MNLGSTELLIVLILVIVVFGAGWLPKTARNLGRAKVEVDKTQKQLIEAKQQVVDATGLDKAEQAMRKANRALKQTPQGLIKGAAAGALMPKASADESVTTDELAQSESPHEAILAEDETVNIDFSPEAD